MSRATEPVPTDEAIGAVDLTKRYRDGDARVDAVRDLTLSIPRGTFTAVEGPSGSGKTTLLGLLGGMIVPTRGDVRLLGEPIARLRDRHRTLLRRRTVGFVFQDLGLVPGMTLAENVLLPTIPAGGPSGDERKRGARLLDRFGLADLAGRRVDRLSGGQRQRGALARALILDPAVLLLDEPTAHLDADNARGVLAHLAQLRDEGRTIVAATHDPRAAQHPAVDRALALVDGRLGTPRDGYASAPS